MEEKKLTDEEIIRGLENWILHDYTAKEEDLSNALDLIHRLQNDYSNLKERYVKVLDLNEKVIDNQEAEIKRLTEARNDFRQEVITLNNEKLELQKQVDELKLLEEKYNDLAKKYMADTKTAEYIRNRAVKDTAKEILTDAKKWVKEHYKDTVTDSFGERPMLFMEAFGCLLAYLKDKHGVEVE